MTKHKIVLACPGRQIGGASYLFARLAGYLIDHSYHDIAVVDYEDGFVRSYLRDRMYEWIPFSDEQILEIEDTVDFVCPLSWIPRLSSTVHLANDTRLLLWDVHPYNLIEQTALSGFYKALPVNQARAALAVCEPARKRRIAKFVEIGLQNYGLAFMCQKNYLYNKTMFDFKEVPVFLPIAVEEPSVCSLSRSIVNRGILNVAWLSRLDWDKLPPILQLLYDIGIHQRRRCVPRIMLHLIGDGNAIGRIKQYAAFWGIEIMLPGRIESNILSNYLTNIDVGFGIGTSALEFAIRGIPTVLTKGSDCRFSPRPEGTHYQWLFDAGGFDVSVDVLFSQPLLESFGAVIETVYSQASVAELGQRCYQYVLENHGVPRVARRLGELLSKCTFLYEDVAQSDVRLFSPGERILWALKGLYKRLKANSVSML